MNETRTPGPEPLWYKDAVIYELSVRAFHDSNGDGIGDLRGLIAKLDYLQDLGVTALWLMPFYSSPWKDDGYDIADYTSIHPAFGTLDDFKTLIDEAHGRGLHIITELVLNHTSDQHPWFQRARQAAPGDPARDFYVWSETPDKYAEARVIFKDFESSNWAWDQTAGAYYWHRFYAHQPDLNYDNPAIRAAMREIMGFWFSMGVDGLRLAAVPYLFEREGTTSEGLPETHEYLKTVRRAVDEAYSNRLLLAAADQWPEEAAAYMGEGDECQMAFHFPIMPRLFMAIRKENRFPIVDILNQTPAIPENSQWALFLRSHDELTLEMVTDEERDYMQRAYALDAQAKLNAGIRRRLAPLLENDRRRIELMHALLFALPGTPVLYYGDEIGMGDNIYLGDRAGVRTPMQWSPDRNAGFSRAQAQQLYLPVITTPEYHYETVNVEAQQRNPSSLLWWMKQLIALRKRHKALSHGTLEMLYPDNRKLLCFVRRFEEETVLVVANLSHFLQHVNFDLGQFAGLAPVELSGQTRFPPIDSTPYALTIAPHTLYWFALQPQRTEDATTPSGQTELPVLVMGDRWESVVLDGGRNGLQAILPAYMRARRWFRSKAQQINRLEIVDTIPIPFAPMPSAKDTAYLCLVRVEYVEGDAETYLLPLAFAIGEQAESMVQELPQAVIARLQSDSNSGSGGNQEGLLYDALWEPSFTTTLLEAIAAQQSFRGNGGELAAAPTTAFSRVCGTSPSSLPPRIGKAEQSNTSIACGERMILKLFRRLEAGLNPDLEVTRFITEHTQFASTPPVAGALEYRPTGGEPVTVGILQGFVQNEGDAWEYTLESLEHYFERALASQATPPAVEVSTPTLLELTAQEPPALAYEMLGDYLESARLLGQRTAELHLALASDADDPNFAPEPFTLLYQRSLYQSMRTLASQVFDLLRRRVSQLPDAVRPDAQATLDLEDAYLERLRAITTRKATAMRTRTHGDYHLGQVLYTGKDFVIIDFEGEPGLPMSERRFKRSALRDVAGMLRSFHYAAYAALFAQRNLNRIRASDMAVLESWTRYWHLWVSVTYLKAYLETSGNAPFIPQDREELRILLEAYLLEKAIYELGYELNNRPDWVMIPVQSILQLLQAA